MYIYIYFFFFSQKKVPSFHAVPFLQNIKKILKLFCNFQSQMRGQADIQNGLNLQNLFSFRGSKMMKTLRALLWVSDERTAKQY